MALRNFLVEAKSSHMEKSVKASTRSFQDDLNINLFVNKRGESYKAIGIYCLEKRGVLTVEINFEGETRLLTFKKESLDEAKNRKSLGRSV